MLTGYYIGTETSHTSEDCALHKKTRSRLNRNISRTWTITR